MWFTVNDLYALQWTRLVLAFHSRWSKSFGIMVAIFRVPSRIYRENEHTACQQTITPLDSSENVNNSIDPICGFHANAINYFSILYHVIRLRLLTWIALWYIWCQIEFLATETKTCLLYYYIVLRDMSNFRNLSDVLLKDGGIPVVAKVLFRFQTEIVWLSLQNNVSSSKGYQNKRKLFFCSMTIGKEVIQNLYINIFRHTIIYQGRMQKHNKSWVGWLVE